MLYDFNIETLIQRAETATFSFEYNCHMRRIYPWDNIANTKRTITEFGFVYVVVDAYTKAAAHEHDEEETFLIISGKAELELEGQTTILHPGDVAYIPRYWQHQIKNPYSEKLVFADIYWDFKGRSKSKVLGGKYEQK